MAAHILFVDDEPNILRGLQRTFRRMRKEWDMAFMEGGEAALKHLTDNPADVIVSDMRMPGVDGAAFLTEAAKSHPGTIRIILSGEADREMTFRTLGVSHQFLPKPCNTDSLCEKIQQSLAARNRIGDAAQQAIVSGTASLPVSDQAIQTLRSALDESTASLEEASETFESDPGLAAKVLQLANSAYFGIGQRVNSPAEAVKLLGVDILRPIFERGFFPSASDCAGLDRSVFDSIHQQSQILSAQARDAAADAGASQSDVELAQLAGLLHGIGSLIICSKAPDCYSGLENPQDQLALAQAEQKAFGCPQSAFGGYLALLWGLPDSVCEAISDCAEPQNALNPENPVLRALHKATQSDLGNPPCTNHDPAELKVG